MNMMVSDSFAGQQQEAETTPALSQMVKQWEQKLARNSGRVGRAGGVSLMAFSLAACGGGSDNTPTTPTNPTGPIFLANANNSFLIDPQYFPTSFGDGDAVRAWFENVTSKAGLVLTPTSAGQNTTAGDDVIIGTSAQVHGGFIDGGAGNDTLEINLITGVTRFGSNSVETIKVSNNATGSTTQVWIPGGLQDVGREIVLTDPVTGNLIQTVWIIEQVWVPGRFEPVTGPSEIDFFATIGVQDLVIDQGNFNAGPLNIVNVRGNPDLEFTGHFSADVSVELLGITNNGAVDVTLTDVTANARFTLAHNGGTVNLTTQGTVAANVVDNADFGDYLRSLNITGDTALELGRQGPGVEFRATAPAVIDASGAAGGVWINVAAHTDVTFTGGAGDDTLSVAPALVPATNEFLIKLTADLGAGANTLIIEGNGGAVAAGSTIASTGTLALIVTSGDLDLTRVADVSAIDSVIIVGGRLELTSEQVAQIGIDNFVTDALGTTLGQLAIVGVQDGDLLDLSAIKVGQVVEVVVGPGNVTLDPASVLGNANAGVSAIVIDVTGSDSSLTLTGQQFIQLEGTGRVRTNAGEQGTHNPNTNEFYEGALTLVDVANDLVINLNFVSVDTTVVLEDGFTATADFDITNAGGIDLTLSISGAVDLSETNGLGAVDAVIIADGAELTINDGQAAGFSGIVEFEGAATINGDLQFHLDTDAVNGDLSLVDVNLLGDGVGFIDFTGDGEVTLGTLGLGDDVDGLAIDALGESDITFAGITSTSAGPLNIVVDTGTADTIVDLGVLSATAKNVTVTDNGPGSVSVGLADIPAGAAWNFSNVELVIDSVAGFGAGASIHLGPGTTLSLGDGVAITDILPFLTSTSLVPLDSSFTAAEITEVLSGLSGAQATIDVTDMTNAQLVAISNDHLKVNVINGDLALDAGLSALQITRLGNLQSGSGTVAVDATGMTAAQKAAAAAAANLASDYSVTGLSLNSDDNAATIDTLLSGAEVNSSLVDGTDLNGAQKDALIAHIANIQNGGLTNLTLVVGDFADEITTLLSKAAVGDATVDEDGGAFGHDQFTAIYEQIEKIDTIVNWDIAHDETANFYELEALLPLAVDATVDAFDMTAEELSLIAENIAVIEAEGIRNLTVSAEQTADELSALLGKAALGSATVDLSDMTAEQIAAVVDNADHVNNVSVGTDSAVTLTLAQLATLDAAGLTPVNGEAADEAGEVGGSITITVPASGTLDLSLVNAGAAIIDPDAVPGTLTLDIAAGANLTIEGGTTSQVIDVTGAGTLTLSESIDVSGVDLTVAGTITIVIPAADPGIVFGLTAEQADALADAGVAISRPAAVAPAVAGTIVVNVPDSGDADPVDLSDLDLSLVDELILNDGNGTILSTDPADLPALITGLPLGTNNILVVTNTDWTGYTGEIGADIHVAANATVTISAATADQMNVDGIYIAGFAAGAGETGGSIVITDLTGDELDLAGVFNAGGAGAGTAGTFTVLVDANVALHADTELPPTATVVVDAGVTLTVNGLDSAAAASSQATTGYTGQGTVNYTNLYDVGTANSAVINLSSNAVGDGSGVRNSTLTFESTDEGVVVNGFEAVNLGGFNGRFLFDDSTDPDTLGLHSLNLTDFATNGSTFVSVDDLAGLDALASLANVGIAVIRDGADPTGLNLFGATGAAGSDFFLAYENGADTEISYWSDANNDGIIDGAELTVVATLTNTGTDQLGSANFVI